MPPKGRCRKRPAASPSAESWLNDIRQEVDRSLTVENNLLDAYRSFTSTQLDLDAIRNLPAKALFAHVVSMYELPLVSFVTSSAPVLAVLPESLRSDTVSRLTGLPLEEASLLHEACSVLHKSIGQSLQEPHVGEFPILLAPPTGTCYICHRMLHEHNRPIDVFIHRVCGKSKGLKFCFRCDHCMVNYNYERYGNKSKGRSLYPESRPFVEATDVCFVERKLLEFQCALANHCWVSFSGFSTSYNEVFNPLSGEGDYSEKQCSSAFWNGELEDELRELGKLDCFGLLKTNEDREKVMTEVDKIRAKSVYPHSAEDCSETCKTRGCGKLWVIDGQWKLMFSHCMMQRKNFVQGLPLVNYPNVCTNSPQFGKAFCEEHLEYLKDKHPQVPTDIRSFLKYCGIQHRGDDTDPAADNESIDPSSSELLQDKDVSKVEQVLSSLGNEATPDLGNSAVEAQGNTGFIESEHNALTAVLEDCLEPEPTTCNKETGGKQRLQKWSRGHLFIVRGGGIIDKWNPLFKSESPSQVFVIVLSWLFTILKAINPLNWNKVVLAYDNMCHLDGLKAARRPLPWRAPWDKAWISISKIIDVLHMRNHKDKLCKEKYDPAPFKEELPQGNTMAAEQTFVWLSRFKKILCAMPKVHHLFYLHRMVKRRNKYTVTCYKNGKKPLLPKARRNIISDKTGQNN